MADTYDVWVVEAVSPEGRTLWRQIFVGKHCEEDSERLFLKTRKAGVACHRWNMM